MSFFDRYEFFKFERRGKVLNIILNNPEKLNAFSEEGHRELSRVFFDAAEDLESEIIVVTGAGRAFTAGGDLEYMQKLRDNPELMHRTIREAKRFVFTLLDCEKPVICKVNGDAIGLGTTLSFLADITFSTEAAKFGDPHNNVALMAGDGGSVIWPQLMGYARAKHYLFTGDVIKGKEAQEMGLIHKALAPEELDAAVDAYCDRLLAMPIQSVRWTKQVVNIPLKQLAHSMMDAGMAYEHIAGQTEDHQEAINAFRERRKPVFQGK
ncbi:enoyl-CoA hydratase/carnithine racemase [Spongiibacter sp. IMCC21906]|uniref:enoyl-CoA hydratase/isomerase family protein n=1 Tax=Spongiibacter sp. IMCC21906 TaxID=1620392 RepID=UPI00062DFDC7|nr:enoyl-CoA hydratase-related protein [Spongiibacter sp. IMCC21906]AKH68689.1 enoyl-CoA hydratase/carnithine racemase [Spongiibacter sp. IMCC21906]